MTDAAPARVAVVGGGWAGCAAAVTLAAAGVPVTLIEQAPTLGGRARRVVQHGIEVDNGQHVLLGAYRQTLALLADVHRPVDATRLFHRLPLTLRPFGERRLGEFEFIAWKVPGPLHIAAGLLSARGLSWHERVGLIAGFRRLANRGFQCGATETVAQCFAATPPRAFAAIWAALSAALNTPRSAPRPRCSPVCCAPRSPASRGQRPSRAGDRSFRVFSRRRGTLHHGARAAACGGNPCARSTRWRAASRSDRTDVETFAAAIVAVGPHQLATLSATPRSPAAPFVIPSHASRPSPTNRSRRSTLDSALAFHSAPPCFASTMPPASGPSIAAVRWTGRRQEARRA